jgi:hypothetical protein
MCSVYTLVSSQRDRRRGIGPALQGVGAALAVQTSHMDSTSRPRPILFYVDVYVEYQGPSQSSITPEEPAACPRSIGKFAFATLCSEAELTATSVRLHRGKPFINLRK